MTLGLLGDAGPSLSFTHHSPASLQKLKTAFRALGGLRFPFHRVTEPGVMCSAQEVRSQVLPGLHPGLPLARRGGTDSA